MELTFIFPTRVFGGRHQRNAFNWLNFNDLMILQNYDEYR